MSVLTGSWICKLCGNDIPWGYDHRCETTVPVEIKELRAQLAAAEKVIRHYRETDECDLRGNGEIVVKRHRSRGLILGVETINPAQEYLDKRQKD